MLHQIFYSTFHRKRIEHSLPDYIYALMSQHVRHASSKQVIHGFNKTI